MNWADHGSVIWTFWMSSPWSILGELVADSFKSVIAVSFLGVVSFVFEIGSYDPLALVVAAAVWFVVVSAFLVSSVVVLVDVAALASAAFFFFSSSKRVMCLKMASYCSFLRASASLAAASASTYWSSSWSTPPSSWATNLSFKLEYSGYISGDSERSFSSIMN